MSGRTVIEREWTASMDLVWELWATPKGMSSWWGPVGFEVEVTTMDLRVGGAFAYTMRASNPETAAAMEKRGRPATFSVTATYTRVELRRALAFESPFGEETLTESVEFSESDGVVKAVIVIDATKPEMTGGASMGWRSALGKLDALLAQ